MNLPDEKNLPVNLLSACFNKTTASYKYYWFLSILQSVEANQTTTPRVNLFARMVSNAWYTVSYFNISFGKQDKLPNCIYNLRHLEGITIDENKEEILKILLATTNKQSLNNIYYFDRYVPYRFLRPWYPGKSQSEICSLSHNWDGKCLYALRNDCIIINPEWISYLHKNIRILKDFCYWNLAIYLQAKNPNVPDIPNKLIKHAVRSSLLNQRRRFWDIVFDEVGTVNCIYTEKYLTRGNYAIEHFIPYSFVSYDLMWNLIPADKAFNSTKSNKLPPLNKYFENFYYLQKTAIEIISEKTPNNSYLEDYLTIFPDVGEINKLPEKFTKEKFRERLSPLITIASNNGFEFVN